LRAGLVVAVRRRVVGGAERVVVGRGRVVGGAVVVAWIVLVVGTWVVTGTKEVTTEVTVTLRTSGEGSAPAVPTTAALKLLCLVKLRAGSRGGLVVALEQLEGLPGGEALQASRELAGGPALGGQRRRGLSRVKNLRQFRAGEGWPLAGWRGFAGSG
jgi:hypothetical protein